jgi:dihydroneopterin aldolase
MAEDHVGDLKKARDELIRQRRASISALTEGSKHTEHQLDTLIRYEQAIEAIDRAIKEEQRAAKEQLAAELAASVQPQTRYED